MHLRLFGLAALWLQALLLSCPALAQKALHRQLTLVNENDNYAFSYTDRYYTNGIMLRYVQAAASESVKRTTTIEAGQMIFTPYTYAISYRKAMDRPFTGLLYLKALRTRIASSGRLWQWGATAGIVGEKAFGRQVQQWHHRTWRLKPPYGWATQLQTGVGFNLEGRVVQPLLHWGSPAFGLKVDGCGSAQAGMLQVQAAAGALFRLGSVRPNGASAAFDTRVSRQVASKATECYLFYEPQAQEQWYNATLQGTLGQQANHYFTTEPARRVYQQKAGFVFAPQHWTAMVAFTHKSKEAVTMRANENWGTVALAYRW